MLKLHDTLAAARARREEEGEKGFTLIELLVVVIIIGILAAIAIPVFLGQQDQARGSAAQSAVTNAKTEIVSALVEDGRLTQDEADAVAATYTDGPIVVVANVGANNTFCVQATHNDVPTTGDGNVWSATHEAGGVVRDACA